MLIIDSVFLNVLYIFYIRFHVLIDAVFLSQNGYIFRPSRA